MLNIKHYARPQSIKEAYQLLMQKKSNVIVGGMLWLKMQNRTVHTAIDLQDLGLDQIEETDDAYRIGCMTTLRDLELHPGLNALTQGAMADSVKHIVGVQFRNLATIGGSLYGRFGFSDVLTLFLVLGAKVDLYQHGVLPLEDFARLPRTDRDLLIRVIVPKAPRQTVYLSQRNSATDFPVLTCAAARMETGDYRIVIGARPLRAVRFELPAELALAAEQLAAQFAENVKAQIVTGSNMRGSAEYRKHLAGVLTKRAVLELEQRKMQEEK